MCVSDSSLDGFYRKKWVVGEGNMGTLEAVERMGLCKKWMVRQNYPFPGPMGM